MSPEYIKLIERKNPLLIGVVSLQSNFEILHEAGIKNMDAIEASFKEDTYVFYFSKIAIDAVNNYLLKCIKDNNPCIDKFYEEGLKWNKKADEWVKKSQDSSLQIDNDTYTLVKNDLRRIFHYSTIMPWWILSSINVALERGEDKFQYNKAITMFEELRGQTKYPQFFEHVTKRYFEGSVINKAINDDLASLLTPHELGLILIGKSNITNQQLEQRKKFCIIEISADNEDEVTFSYDENQLKNKQAQSSVEIKEIKGAIAYRGFTKGKVKIVNSVSDMQEFQEGGILVSLNTSPALMSAIIKCSAIVTDEGGIMCHASIISRELKKPCIIGTKIATQVLKDGDMVEVDADKGIVRILEKSS